MSDRRRRWLVFAAAGAAVVVAAVGAGLWLWPEPVRKVPSPTRVASPFAELTCRDNGGVDLGGPAMPDRQLLAPKFVPSEAVMCVTERRVYPGEGEYEVVIEKRATTGFDELVRELRTKPEWSGACLAYATDIPHFLMTDVAGHLVFPAVPQHEWCDQTKEPAIRALAKLPWKVVGERRGSLLLNPAQLRMNCGPRELPDPFLNPPTAPSLAAFRAIRPTDGLRACLYAKTSPAARVTGIQKGDGLLRPEKDSVLKRLKAAVAPAPCKQSATELAMLYPADPKVPEIAVELNGCGRITSGGRVVSRLLQNQRDEVRAALAAAMPQ